VWLYPEWNYKTRRYQADWCWLREVTLPPGCAQFVPDTVQRYRGLLSRLRRTFEALRGGLQRERQQPAGDELDIDALISAYADVQRGEELSPFIYRRWQRHARSVAVLFMVDMSGSTKGWINQAERESLVLLAEVLTVLGDQFAIYGFSGLTRRRCDIFPVKRFEEAYDQTVQQRISAIGPRDYTRMGVAVRHLTQILRQQPAATRLLITLSDGKPDDEGDNYRGMYGIEDTRQALLEARRLGIHPFCITIDSEARTYLPHLYGDVNYVVIDQVAQLPLKVADIYRKLTH
jgi:nitric oxide reductase NorD protein